MQVKFKKEAHLVCSSGSPPLVRVKRPGAYWVNEGEGITPACAGKTLSKC